MYRVFNCFGRQHPNGSPSYFFIILLITQEDMKYRSLSGTEIMKLAQGDIASLTSAAEDSNFSVSVDELFLMIEHQYGKTETIRLLEDFMELVARSTNGETFDPAAFLKKNINERVVSKIYAAISLCNQGSAAQLMGNLATGAFALSRQETMPAWEDPKLTGDAQPPAGAPVSVTAAA